MSEWKPIEKYDKLKNKPKHCIFWFKEKPASSKWRNDGLDALIGTNRTMGFRECTHYAVYESPKD